MAVKGVPSSELRRISFRATTQPITLQVAMPTGRRGPHLQQSKGKPQIPTNKGTFICGYMWIYVYICMCTCVHNMYYTESGVHLTHVVVSECMQGWMHKVCFLPTRCQRRGQVAEGTTARQDNANTEHRVAPTSLTSQDGTL